MALRLLRWVVRRCTETFKGAAGQDLRLIPAAVSRLVRSEDAIRPPPHGMSQIQIVCLIVEAARDDGTASGLAPAIVKP